MSLKNLLILLIPVMIGACTLPDPCAQHASSTDIKYTSCRAHQGAMDAQLELANAYLTGEGVEQNAKKAARWYKRAAARRSGMTYIYSAPVGNEKSGRVIPVQTGTGSPGSPEAKYQLALLYLEGSGVKQNEDKARKWLQRAVEQGSAKAGLLLERLNRGEGSFPASHVFSSHDATDHR